MKDMGDLSFFLGINVSRFYFGLVLDQSKYILQLLEKSDMVGAKSVSSPAGSSKLHHHEDCAGCPINRRSTNGYCVFLEDNPISWCSRKQTIVSRSSTEAKYRCVATTAAELCWLSHLLQELHVPLTTALVIYCDNVSAIALTLNPVFHSRTKHIEVDVHFVREKVARKQLSVHYVTSGDQIADIMTKGLFPRRVKELQFKLNLVNRELSLREADNRHVVKI